MPAPSQHAFAEKVALITDGTSSIGRAVAMQLALYGSYVIVGFPNKTSDENKSALDELKSLGTLANAVEADISTVEGAKTLVDETEKLFGRIDLLVNCLKFQSNSEFEHINEEEFDKTINANLKAAFFITQEAMRLMSVRPKPKIVNVLTDCDSDTSSQNTIFTAVNSALIGVTQSLANTLPEKFRVNGVAVGKNKKPSMENLDPELFPLKSGLGNDDIARTILYLLSSEAIGLNGQILKVG